MTETMKFLLIDYSENRPKKISTFEMSQHEFANCFDETILGHLSYNPSISEEPLVFDLVQSGISFRDNHDMEGEIRFSTINNTKHYTIIPA